MLKYPKVNYIGNKEKIVDWIIEELPVKKGKVLDIFAGGCSVSYALKKSGYAVIANDILYADYVIAKALIENNDVQLSKEVFEKKISEKAIIKNKEKLSFLTDRLYYAEEVDELAKLVSIADRLKGFEKYMFLALLRRAMIRKLPYSRMNIPWNQIQILRDEEYSYSKYKRKRAYHNQTFESHMLENIDDYNKAIFSAQKCSVLRTDVMRVASVVNHVDIVYMDPPYPSTMNDYDAFYGLFDEMFKKKSEHTDFTNRSTFLDNIEALVSTLVGKTDYIVLSQNTRVKPEPELIKKMLSKFGKVAVKEKSHNYQVTGKDNKNASKELLFILEVQHN